MKEAFIEVFGTLAFLVLLAVAGIIISAIAHYLSVKVDEMLGMHHFDGISQNQKSSMFDYYMYNKNRHRYEGGTKMEVPANHEMRVGDYVDGKGIIVGFIGYNQPDKDNPNNVYCTEELTEMYDDSRIKAQYLAVNGDIITVKAVLREEM